MNRDRCGEQHIGGKNGKVYDNADGRYGVLLTFPTAQCWNNARRKMERAGFLVVQDGDSEGTALFSPEDCQQVQVACDVVRPYRRKRCTPQTIRKRREALAFVRSVKKSLSSEASYSLESISDGGVIRNIVQVENGAMEVP